MATFTTALTEKHQAFIAKQHMFFVATAPTGDGRINLSPKGLNSFRVLSDSKVAYLDLTGSGNETAAHLKANGRITLMFCAFEGAPSILRIYGRGRVVRPGDVEWVDLSANFTELPGMRQIMMIEIDSVQTSCGYAVPEYSYVANRTALLNWAEKKGPEALEAYRDKNNVLSIDGQPTGYRPTNE